MAAGGWGDWSEVSMLMGAFDGGECDDDVGGWENHERRMTLCWTMQWIDDNAGELEMVYDMIIFGISCYDSLHTIRYNLVRATIDGTIDIVP